jgi:CheY-like chemotaxis protein
MFRRCCTAAPFRKTQVTIRVLVVEDSPHMQEALKDLFATVAGYEVVASFDNETSATEWLLLHTDDWQLALIDLLLKEGSGFSLVQHCRKSERPGKIVVLSDFVTPVVKDRCLELGADAVFTKGEAAEFALFLETLKRELVGTIKVVPHEKGPALVTADPIANVLAHGVSQVGEVPVAALPDAPAKPP